MQHTWSSNILSQLKDIGFTVHKDLKENQWGVYDKAIDDNSSKNSNSLLIRSRSLGDLMRQSAKEFGLK